MTVFFLQGSLTVEIDIAYDVGVELGDAMEYTRQSAIDGYIFLDWFAIPQITARAEGVNEENTRSDAALAVQSIPFYVEADFFGGLEKWWVNVESCVSNGSELLRSSSKQQLCEVYR